MVAMLGHDVPRVFMAVFGVGCGLAGLAGAIAGPALVTQPSMAGDLGPILFVVVIVGGMGSLAGAFVASLLVGIIQTLAVAINLSLSQIFGSTAPPFLGDLWTVTVAQLAPIIPYAFLILVLDIPTDGLDGNARIVTRTVHILAPWFATAAVFALAPLVFRSGFALTTMSLIGVNVVFALSFNILLGQAGLLSFGHAVYYGLGGFVAIHALNAAVDAGFGLPLPAFVPVGGLGGLAFGFLFGPLVSRRGGLVFSMITLGIGELVSSSSFILRSFFGGEEGIVANRTAAAPFFGLEFGPQIEMYYLTAASCFLAMVAVYALTRTPLGRIWNARATTRSASNSSATSRRRFASTRAASRRCSRASQAVSPPSISKS